MYSHWGVYIGDEEVIHLTGDENDGINGNVNSGHLFTICGRTFNKAYVKKDNFWNITLTSKAYKNNKKDNKHVPRSASDIKESAMEMIGEIGYNVLWNNCEHFAAWCRYGKKLSEQADSFWTFAASTGIALIAGALVWAGYKKEDKKEEKA